MSSINTAIRSFIESESDEALGATETLYANAPPGATPPLYANAPPGAMTYVKNADAARSVAPASSNYGAYSSGGGAPPSGAALGSKPLGEAGRLVNLKTGGTRLVKDMGATNQGEDKKGVEYVRDLEILTQQYRVTIAGRMTRRDVAFDTGAIKEYYITNERSSLGASTLGSGHKGQPFPYPAEWMQKGLIWVCAADPKSPSLAFYSHVGKIHKFHHSSFMSGGEVVCAGEWIVEAGRLLRISANSGHYQPTLDCLYRAVLQLASAFNSSTTVFLYDTKDDQWVDRPVAEFISRPSDGGRYWAHPRAPNP